MQVSFGEQRAYRPVNQPAGQNFLLGWTAFTLDETARNLAGGICVFTVIHREGKEAGAGLGFLVRTRRHQNGGVSGADYYRPIRLPGNPARLQRNFTSV